MIQIDAKGATIDEKEVTAFVQQQLMELADHLSDKSSLQVRLTQRKDGFEAELTAFEEEGEIQTVGRHKDIFDAIRNAKEGLLDYFVEVEDQLNPRRREDKINFMSRNGNFYLH